MPEGMVLVKKVEEDYFSVAGAKKSKKERKASKKSGLIHNLASLESFAAIRITAPKTLEDVQACLSRWRRERSSSMLFLVARTLTRSLPS